MLHRATETLYTAWQVPQCPFTIEYSPALLEDLRALVMDAFFSLPRGGVEIGGVLLGRHEPGRLRVMEFEPAVCQHTCGPSFVLSKEEHGRFAELVLAPRGPLVPVGWYHSHTRCEIFLDDQDIKIHNEYFSEPWQIALVLRPSSLQPMRAGFFFWEPGGVIHAKESYREFTVRSSNSLLDDLLSDLMPAGAGGGSLAATENAPPIDKEVPEPEPEPVTPMEAAGIHQTVAPEPPQLPIEADLSPPEPPVTTKPSVMSIEVPEPAEPAVPAPEAPVTPESPYILIDVPEPVSAAVPRFLTSVEPARRSGKWQWLLMLVIVQVCLGAGVWFSQGYWMPYVDAIRTPAPPTLHTIDRQGQLEIQWDPAGPVVRKARSAMLHINDGGFKSEVPLDVQNLSGGHFFYARQSERVDVRIDLITPGGQVQAATTFMGKLPAPGVAADDLKSLQRSVQDLRDLMQREQSRRRASVPPPEPKP